MYLLAIYFILRVTNNYSPFFVIFVLHCANLHTYIIESGNSHSLSLWNWARTHTCTFILYTERIINIVVDLKLYINSTFF